MSKLLYADATQIKASERWVIESELDGETETVLNRACANMSEASARRIYKAAVQDVEGIGTVTLSKVSMQGWERLERYEP